MVKSPGETPRRILEAAIQEFAAHGFSGARVDRIAATAGENKRFIYVHFESKENLFDLALAESLNQLVDAVPFTENDLAGYAGELFDFITRDPTVVRLALWRTLERPRSVPMEAEAYITKLRQIEAARAEKVPLGEPLTAVEVMAYVLALAQSWVMAAPILEMSLPPGFDQATKRRHLEIAVRRLLGQGDWPL